MTMCYCGKPLHYPDKNEEALMTAQIKKLGTHIEITHTPSRITYLVPRHYIALHGLKGIKFASLGFEITKK